MKNLLVLIVVIAAGFGLYQTAQQSARQPAPTESPRSVSPSILVPEPGWKEFRDETLGIKFFVPESFVVEPNGEQSVMAKHPQSMSKAGDVEFFYVTVVPPTLQDNESGAAYNYSRTFYNKLWAIESGKSANLSESDGQKEWYVYERLPDEIVAGRKARVFYNSKPWEFPAGISEYRYMFDDQGQIIVAGGYFNETSSTNLPRTIFAKIVNSLDVTQ